MMLREGDQLPAVTVLDDEGNSVTTADLLGGPLVLYFYPKDDTPGCTSEASQFRDSYRQFQEKNARIVGVSRDSVESHQRFKKKFAIPFCIAGRHRVEAVQRARRDGTNDLPDRRERQDHKDLAEGQRERARGGRARVAFLSAVLRLHIVGSSPATQRPGSACSCYLLRTDNAAILLDLGCGALGKLQLAMDYADLDAIVVSHMHADHFLRSRAAALRAEVRREAAGADGALASARRPRDARGAAPHHRPARTTPISSKRSSRSANTIRRSALAIGGVRLTFCATRHYVDAFSIRADYDRRSFTYSADTAPSDAVAQHARGSALFLCETSLGLGTEEGERGHMSASEAGEMASRASAERLVLTHYPAAAAPESLFAAAKKTFRGPVECAVDGLELVALVFGLRRGAGERELDQRAARREAAADHRIGRNLQAELAQTRGGRHQVAGVGNDVLEQQRVLSATYGPSTNSFANAPYALGFLRTASIGSPDICETAVAITTPPSSVPAMRSGLSSVMTGVKSRAMRRSTSGSEKRLNLSM